MSNSVDAQPSPALETSPPLSKNAQKKLALQAKRAASKEQWKAMKRAKKKAAQQQKRALAQSLAHDSDNQTLPCDSSEPPMDQAQCRTIVKRVKSEPWMTIVFDMAFDDLMLPKEKSSLYSQLCRCYGMNRRANRSVQLHLTGLSPTAKTALDVLSVDHWKGVKLSQESWTTLYPSDRLVYLTADSENVLTKFEPDHQYIIGALVDKNRHKGVTRELAQQHHIQTAKLPIRENISLHSSSVLTVNQVFEMILKYLELEDWKLAIESVIPIRKRRTEVNQPIDCHTVPSPDTNNKETSETNA